MSKLDPVTALAMMPDELLALPVDSLELSVRAAACVQNMGCKTIGDVVARSEAQCLREPNFGRKSLDELTARLRGLGLYLDGCRPQAPTVSEYDILTYFDRMKILLVVKAGGVMVVTRAELDEMAGKALHVRRGLAPNVFEFWVIDR